MLKRLLAITRLLSFGILTIIYILFILIAGIFNKKDKTALWLRRPFFISVFWLLGIKPALTGKLTDETALYVGNHVSYLDPFVLARYVDIWPVAKQEVASWPLVGYATKLAGIIFVKRESGKSRQTTRATILKGLQENRSILVYPEGTSSEGESVLPFRKGSFALAAEHQYPVIPVTISYNNDEAPFVGTDKFLSHFIKLFSTWQIHAFIHIGDPIRDADMESLAQTAHEKIMIQLQKMHSTHMGT